MTAGESLQVLRANVTLVCPELPADLLIPDRTLADLGLSSMDRLDVLVGALDDVGLPPKVEILANAHTLGELAAALATELEA